MSRVGASGGRRRGERDGVAKLLEAADMVVLETLPVQLREVVRAEIVVRTVVAQYMVEDHQDTVTDCHHGFLLAQAARQAMELGGQIVVGGVRDRPGYLR